MEPKDKSDLSGTYVFDDEVLEEMEDFEATAVLDDKPSSRRISETGTFDQPLASEDFLDDIDAPSTTGIFEKE